MALLRGHLVQKSVSSYNYRRMSNSDNSNNFSTPNYLLSLLLKELQNFCQNSEQVAAAGCSVLKLMQVSYSLSQLFLFVRLIIKTVCMFGKCWMLVNEGIPQCVATPLEDDRVTATRNNANPVTFGCVRC